MVGKLVSEPLVVFIAIGGLLFGLYYFAPADDLQVIEVHEPFLGDLIAERELVLDRKLTDAEKAAIQNDFIDQEVLVREAMARRLYLNDGGVRHRLADKMFYLLSEPPADPDSAELDRFYEQHRERYRTSELVTFEHRYFAADRDSAELALDAVNNGREPDGSERFYLGERLEKYDPAELAAIFGTAFARELATPETGAWFGPVESGRGWHIVRIEERFPSTDIPREQLEDRLLTDWRGAYIAEARRRRLDELRLNYDIVFSSGSEDD